MFAIFFFVLLIYSTACSRFPDEVRYESLESINLDQDDVIQKLLVRLEFLEDRVLSQEISLLNTKEKHEIDLRNLRDDYEKRIDILTKKFENAIENVKLEFEMVSTINSEIVGTEKRRNIVEETVGDDVPSAEEEALVENVRQNLRHIRTKDNSDPYGQNQRVRRFDSEYNVSFFAKIVQNVHHLGQGQNVIFDTVVTNNGNAYNPYLGAFVVPVGGTYLFSTSLVTFNNDTSHYGIFVNNDRTTILYVNGVDNNSDSTSQTVILQLHEQDTVTVRHLDADKSLVGYHHSLFSGVLIAQDDLSGSSIIGK